MRDIGKNIRDLRIQRNMTQDELAEKLFVTRQTVSNYETGKSRPDIEMLERIAEVLDADIRQVLYGGQNPVETEKLKRLIIGGLLTAAVGILFFLVLPIANRIKLRYFISGFNFSLYCFMLPLFFLLLGWTLAHLTGMALKKEPLAMPWARYGRWFLLTLLALICFITLSFLIPMLTGEIRFLLATGDRSGSDYIHIPQWSEFLFMNLLFKPLYAWHTPYSCAFTLPIGVLLWFFGFPKVRPSDKNI